MEVFQALIFLISVFFLLGLGLFFVSIFRDFRYDLFVYIAGIVLMLIALSVMMYYFGEEDKTLRPEGFLLGVRQDFSVSLSAARY